MDYDSEEGTGGTMSHTAGQIGASDVGTLALLGNNAYGYGGYGRGYGYGTREQYDGTVVNNNVERNAADIAMQNQFNRDTSKEQGAWTREAIAEQGIDQKLETILAHANFTHNQDIATQNAQHIQTMRDMADLRAETAECCCNTQKLVLTENNATRTLLLEQRIAEQSDTISSQRLNTHNDAVLQQMALQTQLLTALINNKC